MPQLILPVRFPRLARFVLVGLLISWISACAHGGSEADGARNASFEDVAADDPRLEPRECPITSPGADAEPPRMANPGQIGPELERQIPINALLAQDRSMARVMVCFELDETGEADTRYVSIGSGIPEVDRAALRVAEVMRFEPGMREGVAVPWTLVVPVTFSLP